MLEQDVGGDLAEDVGHEEDGQGRVVLDAAHAELGLEAEGAGVGDVDAVEEGEQVQHDDEGDDVQVDLGRDAALGRVGRADDLADAVAVARGRGRVVGGRHLLPLGAILLVRGCEGCQRKMHIHTYIHTYAAQQLKVDLRCLSSDMSADAVASSAGKSSSGDLVRHGTKPGEEGRRAALRRCGGRFRRGDNKSSRVEEGSTLVARRVGF